MSSLEKLLEQYKEEHSIVELEQETTDEWISRQDARAILGCSIQRINQLVKDNLLRTQEKPRQGRANKVLRADVLNYKPLPVGRPKGKPDPARVKASDNIKYRFGFENKQKVVYEFSNALTYGYVTRIPAQIIGFGTKKVRIRFHDQNGKKIEAWVKPEHINNNRNKGEKPLLFIRYEFYKDRGIVICQPNQWERYLKQWERVYTDSDGFESFKERFTAMPVTQGMAGRIVRFLGGRHFGKFPEYAGEVENIESD